MKQTQLQYKRSLLKIGDKAILKTAHLFKDGYWQSYSQTNVDVVDFTDKTIELRDSKYPDTRHTIDNKSLIEGRFDIMFYPKGREV